MLFGKLLDAAWEADLGCLLVNYWLETVFALGTPPKMHHQALEAEQHDGVRMAWNYLPRNINNIDGIGLSGKQKTAGIPIGAIISPLKALAKAAQTRQPIKCKQTKCGAMLNPYCKVDHMNKIWICPFCTMRNNFPNGMETDSNGPIELRAENSSIEYSIAEEQRMQAPVFLFLLDTCLYDEEMAHLKRAILQSLLLLPNEALVGLISFGKNVHVHELGWEECGKSYVFRGNKHVEPKQIAKMLGFSVEQGSADEGAANGQTSPQFAFKQQQNADANRARFLLPVNECEYQLGQLLETLEKDRWPAQNGQRQHRCTGAALAVASGLLELTCCNRNSRILLFAGGPPTVGPGQVAMIDLKDNIRSHIDIAKNQASLFRNAIKFYEEIALRTATNGHIIDVFACSLDQVGIMEMGKCVSLTGGYLVLDDSFTHNVFNGSFKRLFAHSEDVGKNGELAMSFNAEMTVYCSRELKVCGCIGHVSRLERKASQAISDVEIGIGGTIAWNIGGADPSSSYALYFELVNSVPADVQSLCFQIATKYRHSDGSLRLRVTTFSRPVVDTSHPQGISYMCAGFDQEAAAVLQARYAVYSLEQNGNVSEVLRWLDHSLIKLVSRFAQFRPNDVNSFRLPQELSFFPQFMFHLRRSQFIQVFNSSPDETTFFRHTLLRENVTNSVIMMQPTLMAYSLDGPATPVILDITACAPNRILLLDTFFHIVIWYGDHIARWRADGMHLRPEYEYLDQLLKAPIADAQLLMNARFPAPRFIECVEKGSQSRFLIAKLNPSITHTAVPNGASGVEEQPVFSEDVSLKVFMSHLCKLAVTPKQS